MYDLALMSHQRVERVDARDYEYSKINIVTTELDRSPDVLFFTLFVSNTIFDSSEMILVLLEITVVMYLVFIFF